MVCGWRLDGGWARPPAAPWVGPATTAAPRVSPSAGIFRRSPDAEVNRILNAFKLNPYELLGARFDAGPDGIQRAYRKARTGGRQGG